MNNWEKYVEFDKNYDLASDKHVQMYGYDKYYTLNKFFESIYGDSGKARTDLDYNIIKDFDQEFLIDLIEDCIDSTYFYHLIQTDIFNFLSSMWKKYDDEKWLKADFPDYEYGRIIKQIKKHLIETANLTKDEYNKLLLPDNPKYKGKYYTYSLYYFYPLLTNSEELILKLVDVAYLDDAQDYLLNGLYNLMEPERLYNFIKILLPQIHTKYIKKERYCFYIWCTGTGANDQIIKILKKLYSAGFDIIKDKEMDIIFHNNQHKQTIQFILYSMS